MSDRLLKESDVIEVVTQYISCDYPTEEMAREDAEVLIGRTPSADRPTRVYEYLRERLGDIVDSEEEFDAWFERMVWHVEECNRLADRLQEWTPCSERMPEYRKTVLISTYWGVKTGFLDSIEAYGDFWEIIEDDATAALHSIYAWMPLPKPWEGADDGK